MTLSPIVEHRNDILTIATFAVTVILSGYKIRYYRAQQPSLELVNVSEARYKDFDEYTEYEFTVELVNDGRDPVFIPDAELIVNGENVETYNVKQYEGISPRVRSAKFPAHEWRTVKLGANQFEHVELFCIGDAVDTTGDIAGELHLDSSEGEVIQAITFERSP